MTALERARAYGVTLERLPGCARAPHNDRKQTSPENILKSSSTAPVELSESELGKASGGATMRVLTVRVPTVRVPTVRIP